MSKKRSIKRSNVPFYGAYNRCYIDKNGEYKNLYTNDKSFGTSSRIPSIHIFILSMVSIPTIAVILMLISGIANGNAGVAESRAAGIMLIMVFFFLSISIPDIKANKEAYEYFKEHPDKLNNNRMVVKDVCPECGTQNDDYVNCTVCGKDLYL
jgi:hypothetical protein